MGSIKKYLFKGILPEREKHHSRLFVDLAENIHIHYREYRMVFSLDEYFEYVEIISKSTNDVRNFLEQNPDYEEQKYPTTIIIAGGTDSLFTSLKNSPLPNTSRYFPNDFAIELQDEWITDEIHIHYRDFRLAMDRERFKKVAEGFAISLKELEKFEKNTSYIREDHPDRVIHDNKDDIDTKQMGVEYIQLDKISTNWYDNILEEWEPDKESIRAIQKNFHAEKKFTPIILSTEKNGKHLIVDGHHRFYAALKLNLNKIEAVVLNINFEETEKIREAEVLLKEFDATTNYEYNLSSFMKSYLGYRLNRYYSSSFSKIMRRQTSWYQALRKIKLLIFGKRKIFNPFN